MLSKPDCGWATLSLGSLKLPCSYLEDVPFLLLRAIKRSCEEHQPASCRIDAEGWFFTVIFDWLNTHVIVDNGGIRLNIHYTSPESTQKPDMEYQLYTVIQHRDAIAKELIADIRRNIDGWTEWLPETDGMDEAEKALRKENLKKLCAEVEALTPSDDMVRIK